MGKNPGKPKSFKNYINLLFERRRLIWTFFTFKRTNIYIDQLQDFVKSFNLSVHRRIGMTPADVKEEDQDRAWARLNGQNLKRPRKTSSWQNC